MVREEVGDPGRGMDHGEALGNVEEASEEELAHVRKDGHLQKCRDFITREKEFTVFTDGVRWEETDHLPGGGVRPEQPHVGGNHWHRPARHGLGVGSDGGVDDVEHDAGPGHLTPISPGQ